MEDGENAAALGPHHFPLLSLIQQAYIALPLVFDSPPGGHRSNI